LSGNMDITHKDFTEGYPLLRLGFPTGRLGNQERIFSLSLTGRQILDGLGISATWHFRPAKLRTYAHSFLLHDLTRNRFVISLLAWAKTKRNLSVKSYLSYEIAQRAPLVELALKGKMTKVSVIPDALIHITDTNTGKSRVLVLEIDQNTQAESRFKHHIAARLAYIRSPQFTNTYGDIPYRIVYATQAVTESAAKARLSTMLKHTMTLLTERKQRQDAQYFRVTTINFPTLYQDAPALFEQPTWYRPDNPTTPIPLLTS
jgi:hypothetical protein